MIGATIGLLGAVVFVFYEEWDAHCRNRASLFASRPGVGVALIVVSGIVAAYIEARIIEGAL